MNPWLPVRVGLVVSCLCMTLGIAMVDYPADISLWQNVTQDPGGWWHETLLIWLGFIVMLDLTYHWENRKVIVLVKKKAEKV